MTCMQWNTQWQVLWQCTLEKNMHQNGNYPHTVKWHERNLYSKDQSVRMTQWNEQKYRGREPQEDTEGRRPPYNRQMQTAAISPCPSASWSQLVSDSLPWQWEAPHSPSHEEPSWTPHPQALSCLAGIKGMLNKWSQHRPLKTYIDAILSILSAD